MTKILEVRDYEKNLANAFRDLKDYPQNLNFEEIVESAKLQSEVFWRETNDIVPDQNGLMFIKVISNPNTEKKGVLPLVDDREFKVITDEIVADNNSVMNLFRPILQLSKENTYHDISVSDDFYDFIQTRLEDYKRNPGHEDFTTDDVLQIYLHKAYAFSMAYNQSQFNAGKNEKYIAVSSLDHPYPCKVVEDTFTRLTLKPVKFTV